MTDGGELHGPRNLIDKKKTGCYSIVKEGEVRVYVREALRELTNSGRDADFSSKE